MVDLHNAKATFEELEKHHASLRKQHDYVLERLAVDSYPGLDHIMEGLVGGFLSISFSHVHRNELHLLLHFDHALSIRDEEKITAVLPEMSRLLDNVRMNPVYESYSNPTSYRIRIHIEELT